MLQCNLTVPHGTALASSDTLSRFVPVTIWMGDDTSVFENHAVTITPITVATPGEDKDIGTLSHPYGTIAYALTMAEAGDTVLVQEGIYSSKETFPLFIRQGVTIQGQGEVEVVSVSSEDDIIRRSWGSEDEYHPTRLENLTLRTGSNGWEIDGGYVTMRNVSLVGTGLVGIGAHSDTHLTLEHVTVDGFYVESKSCAVCAWEHSVVDARELTVKNAYYGVVSVEASFVSMAFAALSYNYYGVAAWGSAESCVSNSEIFHNNRGVVVLEQAKFSATDTTIGENLQTGITALNQADAHGEIYLDNVENVTAETAIFEIDGKQFHPPSGTVEGVGGYPEDEARPFYLIQNPDASITFSD